jgi:capsular polysaccharide biosynthesis protein
MRANEHEIELRDYLDVLWKRKWLIILPTLFCLIMTGIVIFVITPKWEIDAVIQPSKFFIQTEEGTFEEVVVVDPQQIAGQINQQAYNRLISTELNIDIGRFPKIIANNLRETNLVRVYMRNHDIERSKSILLSLFNHLKAELDKKADIEIKEIDFQIESYKIDNSKLEHEITLTQSKLSILRKRKTAIENELKDVRARINTLEKQQLATLQKNEQKESEALGLLLYSNEIQESLRYYNQLNESLSNKNIEEIKQKLDIDNKEKEIKQIENSMARLQERKGRIDFTQLIKEPTSSLYPVYPRKGLNLSIAGILALIIFTILAFFLEYIKKSEDQRQL